MKKEIHPTYYPDAQVTCSCGNTWTTGSTQQTIHTDVCSQCHPFYTGEQRIVDTEGQVDRFYKKLQAHQEFLDLQQSREASLTSPDRPVAEFDLSKRATAALVKAGLETAGQVLEKLAEGESAVLDIEGFGRKSLSDLKKSMRRMGYKLPEAADQIIV